MLACLRRWAIIFPSELPWDKLKETVIGTGPFIWQEYVTGAGSTTVRNPDYFRKGYPCMDGCEFCLQGSNGCPG